MNYFIITISILALLWSCSERSDNKTLEIEAQHLNKNNQNNKVFVFECDKNYSFVVEMDNDKATLFLPDRTITLPHIPSGSGAKYEKDKVIFWSKGEEALLEINNKIYKNCINNRKKAIWESAKLRGMDFRAVGNEPGWNLEISNNRKIVFITNYGSERYEFPTPKPLIDDKQAKTIYKTNNEKHNLEVMLIGKPCLDTMSDESFETTVFIKLDDKQYKGCGNALH